MRQALDKNVNERRFAIPLVIMILFIGLMTLSISAMVSGSREQLKSEYIGICKMLVVTFEHHAQLHDILHIQQEIDRLYRTDKRVLRLSYILQGDDGKYYHKASNWPSRIDTPAHKEDLEAIRGGVPVILEETFEGKDYYDITYPLRDAEGTVIGCMGYTATREQPLDWLLISGYFGGSLLLFVMMSSHFYKREKKTVRLIGEREHSVAALRESEEKYSRLFHRSNDAIFIHDLDGNIIDTNQKVLELFEYTKAEIPSIKLPMLHPDESLEKLKWAFEETARAGSVSFEIELLKKGGDVFSAEISSSLFEIGGKKVIQGIVRDITKRKQAEKALQESETRFRAIFEQAAVGVALTSTRTGKLIQVNQKYCDIVGYSEDELKNLTFQEISHPDDLQSNLDKLQELIDGKTSDFSIEKRYLRRDGSIVWVNLTVSPLWAIDEQPSSHIAVIEDISKRKLMEAEVKTLSGLLPICASCKKIRDDKGYWNQIESYIRDHSNVDFSHSICPECTKKLYPDWNIHN